MLNKFRAMVRANQVEAAAFAAVLPMPLGIQMIYNLLKINSITWGVLLGIWMLLDFIDVKIVRIKDHGNVLIGLSALALIAFFLSNFSQLSQRTKEERYRFSFIASIALTSAWLIFSIVFMLFFHFWIGGSE